MNYFLFFFLTFTAVLFGNVAVTENEPSALVEGMVSAITGDFYGFEEDVVIQGTEPLRLKRSYISSRGGQWSLFEGLKAVRYRTGVLHVSEPNGTLLTYRYDYNDKENKKKKYKDRVYQPLDLNQDAQGLTNTARGAISAHTNLKNQYVKEGEGAEQLVVICPNGTRRVYHPLPEEDQPKSEKFGDIKITVRTFYALHSEELPNGNQIVYSWERGRLSSIRTTDPSGQRTYAQATFHHHGKIKEKHGHKYPESYDFDVQTSDGRTLEYRYFLDGEKAQGNWHLHRVVSADFPPEEMKYLNPERHRGRLLSEISFPRARSLQIGYFDNPGDPTFCRVQTLSSPVGADATLHVTQRFTYHLQQRMTEVVDVEGNPTHYHWDENFRLASIDRFSAPGKLYNSICFVWGANNTKDATNLLCKTLLDEQRKPIHSSRYYYDDRGNVLEEKFYGNLSGKGSALSIDANKFPIENGVELYAKRFEYSQEGKNLLLRRSEDNGAETRYEYLAGTNLPTAEFSYDQGAIKRRKFYEYNTDRILVREIVDDGTSVNKSDLSGVKTRLIQNIHPKTDQPYLGMPFMIEEKYWDGRGEQLLKKTVLHYTTRGNIAQKDIYDALNQHRYGLAFKYDEKGRLKEETNALGQLSKYSYDELGNKVFSQGFGSSSFFDLKYDYSNRLIESHEKGEGSSYRFTHHAYDKRSNRVFTCDSHGYETRYVYDSQTHLKETHFPQLGDLRPATSSLYDAQGQETAQTDAKGYTTHTSYNAYAKPVHIQHPDGAQEHFIYNLDGTLLSHIDQNGTKETFTYDAFGRVLTKTLSSKGEVLSEEVFQYDAYNLVSHTDAEGNVTSYTYDGAGRKISEEIETERIEYAYDSLGRQNLTQKGELLLITEHDLLDRVVEERKEDLKHNILHRTLYAFDEAGNRRSVTRFVHGKESTELFDYDAFNRLTSKKNPLGHRTTFIFDDAQHQQNTIDPLGLQTIEFFNSHYLLSALEKRNAKNDLLYREENLYDANENLTQKETALFHPDRSVTTLWNYGPLDRLAHLTEAAGTDEEKVTTYTYTPKGQLLQTTKPSGVTITNAYDPLDHLSAQYSSDETVHYTYTHNRLGHLLQSKDELNGLVLARTYDHRGRLHCETLPYGLSFENTYDEQGRRTSLALPDSSMVAYAYDPLYLRAVTRYGSNQAPQNLLYTHQYLSYDLSGNPLNQEMIGKAGQLLRTYDLAGQPLSCISPYFAHEIRHYDPVGNVLQARLHNETLDYRYDDLYQLVSEKEHAYVYDALHNRLHKDGSAYDVNSLNQLPSHFTYDPDGNPISDGKARYTYDALDRLITAETDQKRLLFTYDSKHRRIAKEVCVAESGQWRRTHTAFFLYDDKKEIGSTDAKGNLQELRILGLTPQAEIGAAVAIELQGKVFVPLHDLYGNLALLVSLDDQTREEYRYTAFGEERKPKKALSPHSFFFDEEKPHNPWRFSSKRFDDETGLVYFGRRYYIPEHGRWLTPDPLGLDAGPNTYAFVSNAPLTHVDLYGLFAHSYPFPYTSHDFKQVGIAAAHGTGTFAVNTASTVSTVGWAVSAPLRAHSWLSGQSSLSSDWQAHQRSLATLHTSANNWMQRVLPADTSHRAYQAVRGGVTHGLEAATLALAAGPALLTKGTQYAIKGLQYTAQMARMPQRLATRPVNTALYESSSWTNPSSSLSALRLKNRLISQEIAGGHGFEKHILSKGEFPGWIRTRSQYAKHIENVLNNPTRVKELRDGRTGIWHQETETVIIRNPRAPDGGTAFQPLEGVNYFEKRLW